MLPVLPAALLSRRTPPETRALTVRDFNAEFPECHHSRESAYSRNGDRGARAGEHRGPGAAAQGGGRSALAALAQRRLTSQENGTVISCISQSAVYWGMKPPYGGDLVL